MTFSGDIGKFKKKTERAAEMVFRGTAIDLSRRVIMRTPVDEGTARGNWQMGVNKIPVGVLDTTDKSGAKTIETVNAEIGKFKLGDSLFLINNLPYIGALEDGHSDQRPAGMVKVSIVEYQAIVKRNARKYKK